MIEFNLLPDVKLTYIKTRRLKRLVIFVSIIASGVSLVALIGLLVIVDGLQKKHLSDLNHDITATKNQILQTPDINKILTVQNQLVSLPTINAQKPVTSRLFGYLQQLTPTTVSLNNVNLDYTQNSITLGGAAANLAAVNQFVDTLKFTTYSNGSSSSSTTPAFSKVVLSSFSISGASASYDIQASFDPGIFNVAYDVKLNVPNITSTRSVVEQPTALFQQNNTQGSH